MSAAIYLARFCHPVLIIDAPQQVPGRTRVATNLKNFLGHVKTTRGEEFLGRIHEQVASFNIDMKYEVVIRLSRNKDGRFIVETDKPGRYEAEFVVVSVGLSDNMPDISGLGPYFETSIFHCPTCDWYQNKDKKIALIGNSDRVINSALIFCYMHRSPKITVIPSGNNFYFSPKMIEKANIKDIDVRLSSIKELKGKNGYLDTIILDNGIEVDAEAIFTYLGVTPLDHFINQDSIKLERNVNGLIKVNFRTFESSVCNLFAVGACNNGPDQAIIAGGEGALSALEIHKRILTEEGL